MIKVYGSVLSRASMVMVALECLGLEYELVDIPTGGELSAAPEYRALNPTGRVPTLQDGDLVLFETQAILYYLVRKYSQGTLWADTVEGEAEILKWSLFISNQLEVASLDILLQYKYSRENPDRAIIERSTETFTRFLPVVETQLTGREYLTGKKTIADIHGSTVLGWAKLSGFDYSPYPNTLAWIKRMMDSAENQKVFARARGK